jgi:AmmeMemoRadiSam system protein A
LRRQGSKTGSTVSRARHAWPGPQASSSVCIGAEMAAATQDPRFPPLRAEELPAVEVEISVLGTLVPVVDLEDIVIGRDGLVLTDGAQRGVLLPQVAGDHHWTREEFLANLCRKAGVAEAACRKSGVLERFEAEIFSEAPTRTK